MDHVKLDGQRSNETNEMPHQQTTNVSDLLTPVSYLIINNQNGLWKTAKERVEAVTFRRLIDSKSTESQTSSNFSSDSKNDSIASMEVRRPPSPQQIVPMEKTLNGFYFISNRTYQAHH